VARERVSSETVSRDNVILVGFMGAGKSCVGARLASLLGMAHLDTDALIEAEAGSTISEIFRTRGEAWFRRLETRAVRRAALLRNTVISVGGGALMNERNVEILRQTGVLVWLRASAESVVTRLRLRPGEAEIKCTRPLLVGKTDIEQVRSLMSKREAGYRLAHIAIDTDDKSPDEIAREIARELTRRVTSSRGTARIDRNKQDKGVGGPEPWEPHEMSGPARAQEESFAWTEGAAQGAFAVGEPAGRSDQGWCKFDITAGASTCSYVLGHGILARPDAYRAAFSTLGAPDEPVAAAEPTPSSPGSTLESGGLHPLGGIPSQRGAIPAHPGTLPSPPGTVPSRIIVTRIIVITTPLIRLLYGERLEQGLRAWLGRDPCIVWAMVPDGERAKSLSTLAKLYDFASACGIGRDSLAIALGGGTVGDVAGFFAATYMRGIKLIQVPTTLLAMVDSSIGGKTAINLRAAKNLAGTFWQPTAVIADVATLGTLPLRDFTSGLAEAIKASVIGDPELFETLEQVVRVAGGGDTFARDGRCAAGRRRSNGSRFAAARVLQREPALCQDIVRRAVAVKAKLVATDERDTRDRLLLNLGHTLGHAIERAGGFRRWTHGEAVAIGLAAACRASERLGCLSGEDSARVCQALAGLGLPTSIPAGCDGVFHESILAAMALDKKVRGGKLRVVLPLSIGKCSVCEDRAAKALADEIVVAGRASVNLDSLSTAPMASRGCPRGRSDPGGRLVVPGESISGDP
jgi:3-dehydroquinate synthase